MESKSLSTKVTLWFTIMMISMIVILCTVIGCYTSKKMQAKTGNALMETAGHISLQLDQFMWSRSHELDTLLGMNEFQQTGNYTEANKRLNQLHTSFPAFSWIGLTDTNGIVQAATNDILLHKSISDRPVFMEGIKGHFFGDVHEAVLLAKLLPNPTGETVKFVDISSAIYNPSGKCIGVLAAHLNWSWGEETIESITKGMPEKKELEVFVISRQDNTVLLGPKDYIGTSLSLDILKKSTLKQGWQKETWSDGTSYLAGIAHSEGYDDYPGLGWTVLVRQPARIAYADVLDIQILLLLLSFLFSAGCIRLGRSLSLRITKPLNDLSQTAAHLKAGHTVSIPRHKGIAEIEILEETLQSLFQNLATAVTARDKMKSLAMTDSLTGLPNRQALMSYIKDYKQASNFSSLEMVVLYLDLDGFKNINDTFGHEKGDLLLIEIASRLRLSIRNDEIAVRLGGDEFLILLSATIDNPEIYICKIADRLIKMINMPIHLQDATLQVGCSIGGAIWPKDDIDFHTVVRKADEALYYSKCHGKNKFTLYSSLNRTGDCPHS